MLYTVKKVSQIAGISVRTLHFYDRKGLLKPAIKKENGYRYYGDEELIKLQQILFFKELDFSLDKIKALLNSPGFDPSQALKEQKKMLEIKKHRLENLIAVIDASIIQEKGGEKMNNNKKFSVFKDKTYQKYKDEVIKKWGHTDAYKQSMERVSKMSKVDFENVKAEGEDIANQMALLLKTGLSSNSPKVQKQIDRFYKHLQNFYDPTYEMFKGLGEMYVSDERFTEYYEKRATGLAVFMKDAMVFYADQHLY